VGVDSALKRITTLFSPRTSASPPALELMRFRSKAEFDQFYADHGSEIHQEFLNECALFTEQKPFSVDGFCYVCDRPTSFHVDFSLAREVSGHMIPAWRESTVCTRCHLSNRQRAAVHLVETEAELQPGDPLYLTEGISELYKAMSRRHQETEGSEYLADKVSFGKKDSQGIRNEDLTHLTFSSGEFAAVMCFEVLEHVPNYRGAVSELGRVLRPGGKLVMTAPFNPQLQGHSVRARLGTDGKVEHNLEPEYHVDPLNPEGCLCFYHFGWALLDDLRSVGFEDAYVARYASRAFGYLGPDPLMFIATKK
jgi:hypothetical protein